MNFENKMDGLALSLLDSLSLEEIMTRFPFAWALQEKLKKREKKNEGETQVTLKP